MQTARREIRQGIHMRGDVSKMGAAKTECNFPGHGIVARAEFRHDHINALRRGVGEAFEKIRVAGTL